MDEKRLKDRREKKIFQNIRLILTGVFSIIILLSAASLIWIISSYYRAGSEYTSLEEYVSEDVGISDNASEDSKAEKIAGDASSDASPENENLLESLKKSLEIMSEDEKISAERTYFEGEFPDDLIEGNLENGHVKTRDGKTYSYSGPDMTVDFQGLSEINSDIKGWIYWAKPRISYPIVQGNDNSKYISTTFKGDKNSSGAIFMDCNNDSDFSDYNTVIYGHNMKNYSMFGSLKRIMQNGYTPAESFYIFTPDGRRLEYSVFSAYVTSKDTSMRIIYNSSDEYADYLEDITGKEESSSQRMVTLSTCTGRNSSGRLVIHGMLKSEIYI